MGYTEEEAYLASYNINDYERPSVAVDIAAFAVYSDESENYKRDSDQKLSLLLIKRGCHPFKDKWALPGGFLRGSETVEQCAVREISEETGVTPSAMLPSGIFSRPDRDPRGRIISNAFVSIINEERLTAAGDDATDAKWFDFNFAYKDKLLMLNLESDGEKLVAVLKEKSVKFGLPHFEMLESGGLAFDHAEIIAASLSVLQRAISDFDVVFDFLPEKFTIANLRRVQEAVLGIELLPANFRRKAAPYIEETDEYLTGAGHRPALLYKKKSKT